MIEDLLLPNLKFAQLVPDLWLGDRLQKPTFRLKLDVNVPDSLVELAAWDAQQWRSHLPSPVFCDARIPCDRIDWLRVLESLGFGMVDTSITLQCRPHAVLVSSGASSVTVRPIELRDRKIVLSLAGYAFRYSRFHLDPMVDRAIANQIKVEWIANCCDGKRGDRLWVAELRGEVVGFLAALANKKVSLPTAILDLVAVDPICQGQGIGRSLVTEFMQYYRDQCTVLQVGTQAANILALRLYQSLGFIISQSQYLLHYHAPSSAS